MKKKIMLGLFIVLLLVVVVGCKNESSSDEDYNLHKTGNYDEEDKVEFTEVIKDKTNNMEYKFPKDYDNTAFTDMGVKVIVNVYSFKTDNDKLHEYDNKAKNLKEVAINGINYDYFKFKKMSNWLVYIYRAKINDDYYLFEYNVYNNKYDDTQVVRFMNTVIYK